ncbi:hypothetical protein BJY52DRAFT_1150584 [Lactarius psammicola]|nr:hypothetical protein BJY52DRAFT_1150584 [Lactarius psammicola]
MRAFFRPLGPTYLFNSNPAQIASEDSKVILIFSGSRGFTSPLSATSEGKSYLGFARATGLLPVDTFVRAKTESVALDSFQNVLFSVARLRAPIRCASLSSAGRFEQPHRRALCWRKLKFAYEGTPLETEADDIKIYLLVINPNHRDRGHDQAVQQIDTMSSYLVACYITCTHQIS